MKRGDFVRMHGARWTRAERLLDELDRGRKRAKEGAGAVARADTPPVEQLPVLFRQLCADLTLARHRMYGEQMCTRLNDLVIRAYQHLHGRKPGMGGAVVAFFVRDFPAAVCREWRLFWLCSAFFWIPFLSMALSVQWDPRWVQAVLGADGMASMEWMYGGDDTVEVLRQEFGSNFMMFAHYVRNNVSIDFQMLAGGLAGGVGTLVFLLFNGVYLGGATGYVHEACNPASFYTFVISHSALELIAMLIAGVAGMRIGIAVLSPGRWTRRDALVRAGRQALPLIYGAAAMTLLAAVIEGFWSASPIPAVYKWTFGIAWWVALAVYFPVLGRRPEPYAD